MTEDPFVTHRSLLFTVAYEMLGSAADAEDVPQESWLRWADVDRPQVGRERGAAHFCKQVLAIVSGGGARWRHGIAQRRQSR